MSERIQYDFSRGAASGRRTSEGVAHKPLRAAGLSASTLLRNPYMASAGGGGRGVPVRLFQKSEMVTGGKEKNLSRQQSGRVWKENEE